MRAYVDVQYIVSRPLHAEGLILILNSLRAAVPLIFDSLYTATVCLSFVHMLCVSVSIACNVIVMVL